MKPTLSRKPKVAIIAPGEMTVKAVLLGHIRALQYAYEVTVITHTLNHKFLNDSGVTVEVIPLSIVREISLFQDLSCFFKLLSIIKSNQFDLIFSVTPKAGLLAMLAGFFLQTPVRVHMFTGQIWATKKGVGRLFFKSIDWLMAKVSTHVLADSASQRQFLEDEGVVAPGCLEVLGDGSTCGVDEVRFKPSPDSRSEVRAKYLVPNNATMLLFVGRFKLDKGVLELAHAMKNICKDGHHQVYLFFVGPDEGKMRAQIEGICAPCLDKLHIIGFTDKPETFMAAADIFCLPSYREGLPMTVLQAAACEIPSVASRVYGVTDAVQEGVTGLLHQTKNVSELQACLMKFINDKKLRIQMGQAARKRALTLFNEKRVTGEFVKYLDNLIKNIGGP
jgi:glycosyltransferase involved in cell wall biosynthesis